MNAVERCEDAMKRHRKERGTIIRDGCSLVQVDYADLRVILALASRDPEAAKLIADEEMTKRFQANVVISSNIRGGILNHLEDYEWRALLRAALGAANTPEQRT